MLLSVFLPHSDRDEEYYIEALETVRATLIEGRKRVPLTSLLAVT